MNQVPKKPSKIEKLLSEEALGELSSITIRLDSGKLAAFDIANELSVSHDPDVLLEQALSAHSRYTFWEYQAGRALKQVRAGEIELAKLEGNLRFRYAQAAKSVDQYASSATVNGLLDGDEHVMTQRNRLNQLREHWSILKTLANAHDHRSHLLRRLLAKDQEVTTR